jgi:hypothetical protein
MTHTMILAEGDRFSLSADYEFEMQGEYDMHDKWVEYVNVRILKLYFEFPNDVKIDITHTFPTYLMSVFETQIMKYH